MAGPSGIQSQNLSREDLRPKSDCWKISYSERSKLFSQQSGQTHPIKKNWKKNKKNAEEKSTKKNIYKNISKKKEKFYQKIRLQVAPNKVSARYISIYVASRFYISAKKWNIYCLFTFSTNEHIVYSPWKNTFKFLLG